jgi:hypothetical protein
MEYYWREVFFFYFCIEGGGILRNKNIHTITNQPKGLWPNEWDEQFVLSYYFFSYFCVVIRFY